MAQDHDTDSREKAQPLRLNNLELIKALRDQLKTTVMPLLVEFCARGTRHTVCLFPSRLCCTTGHPDRGGDGYTFVGLLSMGRQGGFYPFDLGGYVSPGYVMEKLRMENVTDAENLAAFLNLIGRDELETYYATHICLVKGQDYLDSHES